MEEKYELTHETIMIGGRILHRIRALRDFGLIKKGDLGGFVESEKNLSHDRNCWVSDDAKVFGDACVFGHAFVFGNAKVSGNTYVSGDAKVSGNALVFGDAKISGDAEITNDCDYMVFKNNWSSGRYFTRTKSNNM